MALIICLPASHFCASFSSESTIDLTSIPQFKPSSLGEDTGRGRRSGLGSAPFAESGRFHSSHLESGCGQSSRRFARSTVSISASPRRKPRQAIPARPDRQVFLSGDFRVRKSPKRSAGNRGHCWLPAHLGLNASREGFLPEFGLAAESLLVSRRPPRQVAHYLGFGSKCVGVRGTVEEFESIIVSDLLQKATKLLTAPSRSACLER